MFPLFGILLAAVLLFKLRASKSPAPVSSTPRPAAPKVLPVVEVGLPTLATGADLIEGLSLPQAINQGIAPQYIPNADGAQTPPIDNLDYPFLTF